LPLSAKLEGFLDRVEAMADKATALKRLPAWMKKHLRLDGRPYTFKKHEMQETIAADQHPHLVVKKCSQIGLTELQLRLAAAIAAVTRSRIIYVFPSADFAVKVSTDRFTPIIEDSPMLTAAQRSDAKAAKMRKIGNSTVYFQGASGTSQAISIPAHYLIIDEKDFCNQVVLSQFNSRLSHAEEDLATGLRGHTREFSTPTLPGYGITKDYNASDQKRYTVKCSSCNTTQVPDYYQDYVIPGYNGAIEVFGKDELMSPKYRVSEAYVKCQKCGKDLWKDLINPVQRQWVAKYPERIMMSGYSIAPIDVPEYNKVPAIFRQIEKYETTQDHRNFVVGIEHEDKFNSFLASIFDGYTDAFYMSLEEAKQSTLTGVRIGVDIGKTAHITVGKRISSNTKDIHIIHLATINISKGTLASQIQKYIDAFKPDTVVIDEGPDFSTPQILIADNAHGQVYGCRYVKTVPKAFSHIDPDPDEGLVKAGRSGSLSTYMKAHNSGIIHYPKGCPEEVEQVKEHLRVTKKLSKSTEFGIIETYPKPDEPDHYCHSTNYMVIADSIATDHDILPVAVGVLPGIRGVAIKGVNDMDKESDIFARYR